MGKVKTAWDNFVQSARLIPHDNERPAAASHLRCKTKVSLKVAIINSIEDDRHWGNATGLRVPQPSAAVEGVSEKQAQPDAVVATLPPPPPPPPQQQQLQQFPVRTAELRSRALELAGSYRTRHKKSQIKWMGKGGVFGEWKSIGLAPCYHESLQTDIRNRSRSRSTTRTGQVLADTETPEVIESAEVVEVTESVEVAESTGPLCCVHGNMFVDLQGLPLDETDAAKKELVNERIEKIKFTKVENDLLHHILFCPMNLACPPRSNGKGSFNWRNVLATWRSLDSKLLIKNPTWKTTKQLRDRKKQWAKDKRRKAKRK